MSLQQYEAFIAAARAGSFKQAAAELGYTQAGVSYMMNALEQEMGTALFVRDRSGVRLTADGESLLPWVKDVCASERALQARLAEVRHVESGSVHVAAFASIAIHWLPGIVERFARDHPRVQLEFSCYENQDAMEEAMWHGDFDCGFVVMHDDMRLHAIPLAQDPIYAVVRPDHPLAHADYFPREALASEPYIKLRDSSYTEYDALFDRHDVSPNVRFEMDNDFAAMGMVAHGLGFSLFPKLIMRSAPFPLAMVEPEIPTHRELAIALRSYGRASMAAKAFVECTRKWVADNEG